MMTRKDKKQEVEKVLDVNASMQGTLIFKDPVNLRINGRFEGVLNTKGSLMIGEEAVVSADITGDSIVIAGTVNGNVTALRELKLISPAKVVGDISSPLLSIAEGAVFEGTSRMLSRNNAQAPQESVMSPDDVATYLEIDINLVNEWANNGKLPGMRDGNLWRFERKKIDEWIAQGKIK